MAAVALALAHPLAPAAWWAINSPAVHDALAAALRGGEGGAAEPRALTDVVRTDTPGVYVDSDGVIYDYRWTLWLFVAVCVVLPITVWAYAAHSQKTNVTMKRPPIGVMPPDLSMADGKDFKYGLLSFCADCHYCCYGMLCSTVRTPDTYHAMGIGNYWCIVSAFLFTWLFAQMIGNVVYYVVVMTDALPGTSHGADVCGQAAWYAAEIPLAIFMAVQRGKLREKFGDTKPRRKFFRDFCTYWWCHCCSVIQEARQVDEAQGVKVECCCKLLKVTPPVVNVSVQPPTPVVGNAFIVDKVG
uniref:Uncharacterized protein n=1 Tax=Alexandrium andersonii TaxID=327968 RepID=A0A7S2DG93_9DINO